MTVTHRTPPRACPVCAKVLNACQSLASDDTRPPEPGDLTRCLYCRSWLVFQVDGLRVATDAELAALARES